MAATTIAAVASPPGPGRRGVIRISGPRTAELVRASFVVAGGAAPELAARAALAGRFHDGRGTQPGLLLWMPGPASYTREDVAELHLPGAPPLLAAALARLLELGAVPAAPGEFTRRAFETGRLDLTRAEGVLSLVVAGTRAEARSAAALLAGGLAERVEALRADLVLARALCEASLDFDEADTADVAAAEIEARVRAAEAGLAAALAWERRRVPSAGAPRVVLAGAPNAGKSALFNALADRAPRGATRALVADLAGTTRDWLETAWTVAGTACRLVDTAGLDPTARGPDAVAQELGAAARGGADLVLWVEDPRAGHGGPPPELVAETHVLRVASKADLAPPPPERPGAPRTGDPRTDDPRTDDPRIGAPRTGAGRASVRVSARTGEGLGELAGAVAERLGLAGSEAMAPGTAPSAGLARELSARHVSALAAARAEVALGLEAHAAGEPLELLAERLRAATDALDGVTGRTTSEDVLDRVFGRFCIGK